MKNNTKKGFLLPMVLAVTVVLMILIPALISWLQQDTKQSVSQMKSSRAYNLAEAAIDRGMWKLKSSTTTFASARKGTVITGYNFDVTYSDISNGYYRIKFSSGPSSREVTVYGEGKDLDSKEIRAIKAVFKNQAINGGIIGGAIIKIGNAFDVHWGPIMAWGDILITDAKAAQDYFPRKFSKQVVRCTIGSYDRDTNGLTPPNTDNQEWWSDYPVPELPVLDFASMRSSASLTGTLNVVGCSKMGVGAGWWGANKCNLGPASHAGKNHFQNSYNHPLARKGYTWYWDDPNTSSDATYKAGGDVNFTGSTGAEGHGIIGTVVVRGNLVNYQGDNIAAYSGAIPSNAWEEYSKISKTTGDTSAKNEYPGDDGYQKVRSTFGFGTETWTGGPPAANTDVGIKGFLYVGGNLDIEGPCDINGAVWVVGDVSRAVGASERTIIFYDDSLDLPTLNVVLVRSSWNETSPSSTAWN